MARRKAGKRSKKKLSRNVRIFRTALGVILAAAVVLGILHSDKLSSWLGIKPFKEPAAPDADTSVRFLDVGQGDCTLAVSEGHSVLIDSGEYDESDKVISYIKGLEITHLDCVILTHPHSDHMGEMADIIEEFGADRFIMPVVPAELTPTTASYERLLRTLDKNDISITPAGDMSFEIGGFGVELFTPDEFDDDLNNCSTVIKLTHGENSFLITGDCEIPEERRLMLKGFDLSADVLRTGHHGSANASGEEFLMQVRPIYSVISCSADNSYGHPAKSTLKRLETFSRQVLITRDCGNIVFVSDGKGLTVYTDNG